MENIQKKEFAWTGPACIAMMIGAIALIFWERVPHKEDIKPVSKADVAKNEAEKPTTKLSETVNRELPEILSHLSSKHLLDMSYSFDETTIYWPTDKPFRWEQNRWGPTANGYWYASANYAASEHGGTHLDSPIHFAEKGDTTDKISLDRLISAANVIDIRERCKNNRDYELTTDDIETWEKTNGRLSSGCILVVRTGWGQFWPDKKSYLGTDQAGDVANLHFPGISPKAAEFLVKNRQIDGVAIDTPSLDFGQSKLFETHRILTAANIYGIENLAQADKLPLKGAAIIALPMKIKGGT
ncbi:MAG: cyclase family protein, partial [bacterium]